MLLKEGYRPSEEEELSFVAESSWNRRSFAWGQMMRASTGISAAIGKLGNARNGPVMNAEETPVMKDKKPLRCTMFSSSPPFLWLGLPP